MYTLETKNKVRKTLDTLNEEEVDEGIKFIRIKRRQKKEQINLAEMELMDLESRYDEIQKLLSEKREYIEKEMFNIDTLRNINKELYKRKSFYNSPKIQFINFAFNKLEQEQIIE